MLHFAPQSSLNGAACPIEKRDPTAGNHRLN
jgi:hypothetical protein